MDMQSVVGYLMNQLSTNPALVVIIVLVIVLLLQTVLVSKRIALLTRGKSGVHLEEIIQTLHKDTATLQGHAKKTEAALNNLDARIKGSVRGVAVRRFDPFQNAGGQQSFATSLLNEDGNGVVISGIHSRDGVRVYAKEVTHFASSHELSTEEEQSIADAQKKLH